MRSGRDLTAPSLRLLLPPRRPTRREVLIASALAAAVVVAGAVAAGVVAGQAPAPGFSTDAPIVTSLMLTPGDVPGSNPLGRAVYRPAQVAANAGLFAPSAVLRSERACAVLDGPTSPHQVTAMAVEGYRTQYDLLTEAVAYSAAAPVEADEAALSGRDLVPCVRRLLVVLLAGNGLRGGAAVRTLPLGGNLGDVHAFAVTALWRVTAPDPRAQFSTDDLEFVVLLHARVEVVIIAQNGQGAVPHALVSRVAHRLAGVLEARFPS